MSNNTDVVEHQSDNAADSPLLAQSGNPVPQESKEPGARFALTGYSVIVTRTGLRVERLITTKSNTPHSWTLTFDEVVPAITSTNTQVLEEPSRFQPGAIVLSPNAPKVRVMPSTVPVAKLMLQFIREASETPRDEHDFTNFAQRWISANAKVQPGIRYWQPEASSPTHSPQPGLDEPGPALSAPGSATLHNAHFIGFDVETANDNEGSIIQIGIAVVESGQITATHSWLCRPPRGLEHFAEENIAVHGITAADVANQPPFAERFQQFIDAVGSLPVVAHNARFDFTALAKACRAEGIESPLINYSCTYRWARQAQLGLPNLKLPTLAKAAGFSVENHHDAAADAQACATIALWLMQKYSADSVASLNQALSLRPGTFSGKRLTQVRWDPNVGQETDSAGQPGNTGGSGTNNDFGASANPPARQTRRNAKWDAAKTPDKIPAPNLDADPNGLLFGQRVTLTGDFAPFDKGQLWDKIAQAGANINKGVTKKTTILVAGPWDSMTTKEKRARELQQQGQEIEIWSETDLFNALGLDPSQEVETID